MRIINNQSPAATKAKTMPFAGLGFAMDQVQAAAQTMTPVLTGHGECTRTALPLPDLVVQPSGYSLLVALGREIRGR